MLYLAVSHFDAAAHDARARALNEFGWHEATARPSQAPSLWARLRLGEHARVDARPAYAFRPLETIIL
jgi:hypothetical protein